MALHTRGRGFELHTGDAGDIVLWDIDVAVAQAIVTSPPYFGLRDYGDPDGLGREASVEEYVTHLVATLNDAAMALRSDGVMWLNLGDSYDSEKSLLGVPWRVALALRTHGWLVRSDVIWAKPNPMPESVRDRPTKAYEHLFMLTRMPRYYWDRDGAKERGSGRKAGNRTHKHLERSATDDHHRTAGGLAAIFDTVYESRNMRDVWTIGSTPFRDAHFATFPPELPAKAILASTRKGDTVLDPFSGSATTGMVALEHGRRYIGIDMNAGYHDLAVRTRLAAWA